MSETPSPTKPADQRLTLNVNMDAVRDVAVRRLGAVLSRITLGLNAVEGLPAPPHRIMPVGPAPYARNSASKRWKWCVPVSRVGE